MTSLRELPTSRTTAAVLWWVNFYTQSLPGEVAQQRRDELISDIYEQLVDGERRALSRGSVDRAIASRALRGLSADLSWSRKQQQRKEKTMSTPQAAPKPTTSPVTIRLSSLGWAILALLAILGLATSITEIVEYGGNRFGYVPWPGAGNINTNLVQLICSAVLLVPASVITIMRLIRHRARIA
ncbi:hypothetical protein J7E83_04225 [Arthrobacter sp. ISL-48]|uniref:hypothetical protein n=1 Tax=Arthrobacter sp. ISL-48 TaxID=2819110 RepID=UPI001BE8AD7D|nr:hypothetical protein [Arthrobacter sp. ISL-48]MBT2531345.1 hypothetical protein [Arthrobacter sp. ISL-48]